MVEGDIINRNAESTKLEQVRPSSASKRPEGHLHTALGPGARTHKWEQSILSQGLSALSWDIGWIIYREQECCFNKDPFGKFQIYCTWSKQQPHFQQLFFNSK